MFLLASNAEILIALYLSKNVKIDIRVRRSRRVGTSVTVAKPFSSIIARAFRRPNYSIRRNSLNTFIVRYLENESTFGAIAYRFTFKSD